MNTFGATPIAIDPTVETQSRDNNYNAKLDETRRRIDAERRQSEAENLATAQAERDDMRRYIAARNREIAIAQEIEVIRRERQTALDAADRLLAISRLGLDAEQ